MEMWRSFVGIVHSKYFAAAAVAKSSANEFIIQFTVFYSINRQQYGDEQSETLNGDELRKQYEDSGAVGAFKRSVNSLNVVTSLKPPHLVFILIQSHFHFYFLEVCYFCYSP